MDKSGIRIEKTKQDEIDQLAAFIETLEPQGYLASLFTPACIADLESRIRNDWTLDLFAAFQGAEERLSKLTLESDVYRSNAEIARQRVEEKQARIDELIADKRTLASQLETAQDDIRAWESLEADTRNANDMLQGQLNGLLERNIKLAKRLDAIKTLVDIE